MTTATVIKAYTPDLLAVTVNGKVAVATIERNGTVTVATSPDQDPLTDDERDAVTTAARNHTA